MPRGTSASLRCTRRSGSNLGIDGCSLGFRNPPVGVEVCDLLDVLIDLRGQLSFELRLLQLGLEQRVAPGDIRQFFAATRARRAIVRSDSILAAASAAAVFSP